ncbi:MAG: family 20 glycosylhydrolase [Melioribacteraceae bacterium]|nr:family 20 glycosylhydrolase [Melioribacteraceae bacterium]
MTIKKVILSIIFLGVSISCSSQTASEVNIIPQPISIKYATGSFVLDSEITIISDVKSEEFDFIKNYLQNSIENFTRDLTFSESKNGSTSGSFIEFILDESFENAEDYFLTVNEGITIKAKSSIGLFYGVQSLLQLLPSEIYGNEKIEDEIILPKVTIIDGPRFNYRGMHLDVCRHFFPVDFVKKYIDFLAMHKMNKFHWHLTEDQGWRIEIKKYPKLTEVGAYRNETMGDGKKYGGFYTQEEIVEVVNYAKSRFIDVIPEIEMPGHALAALASYPEYACTDGPFEVATEWGIFDDIYCAGKEETFIFIENILAEVIELFPGEYVHIGGDEAPKTKWKNCKDCQNKIRTEGLKDEHELQSYFIRRIEKFLSSKGKKLVGWDEILEGGLAPQATVMSWRGTEGGIAAAKSGHDAIMTPTSYCYFDYYQSKPETEPISIGGYLPISKVYGYEPIPTELNSDEAKHILGAQANVWTEYIPNTKHVEYMVFPRIAAMSEVVWSKAENKSYSRFVDKLGIQFKRYSSMDVNYSSSIYNVHFEENFDTERKTLSLELGKEVEQYQIRYKSGESEEYENYTNPITLDKSRKIIAALFSGDSQLSSPLQKEYFIHKGFVKEVKYNNTYHNYYPANHQFGLVDGIRASNHYADGKWQGFLFNDLNIEIDLGEKTKINSIRMDFLQRILSSIFIPKSVEILSSDDGVNYSRIYYEETPDLLKKGEVFKYNIKCEPGVEAKYIKVIGENIGNCPPGHSSEGNKSWLFIDEIIIE